MIDDFGPLHSFWLFSYERFNRILGNYPNNNKAIEPQLMKKFLQDNALLSIGLPSEFYDDFSVHPTFTTAPKLTDKNLAIDFPPRCRTATLNSYELTCVQTTLAKMLNAPVSSITVNSCFKQYSSIQISGKMYNSTYSFISLAQWNVNMFGTPPSCLPQPTIPVANGDEHIRPVEVHYFANIPYSHGKDSSSETFAAVSWFAPHPNRYEIGKPVDIWCKSVFEVNGPHAFVPCCCIKSRCAYTFTWVESLDECVLIVVGIVQ